VTFSVRLSSYDELVNINEPKIEVGLVLMNKFLIATTLIPSRAISGGDDSRNETTQKRTQRSFSETLLLSF